MEIQLINDDLLTDLYDQASASERLRQAFDLRTTPVEDSQRMLNVLEPGTHVPIHRHLKTSETVVCLERSSTRNCPRWTVEVPYTMGIMPWTSVSLPRWRATASAPARGSTASRFPRWPGTP